VMPLISMLAFLSWSVLLSLIEVIFVVGLSLVVGVWTLELISSSQLVLWSGFVSCSRPVSIVPEVYYMSSLFSWLMLVSW
jgi:hypothetical protein